MIGVVLGGRYRIDKILGKGGFGTVYRGAQVSIDQAVAIKVLNGGVAEDEDAARRFVREAQIISKLRHPQTLRLYDHGETDAGQLYLVTEFLDGLPLSAHLKELGRLSPHQTLRILEQVCGALVEAHEKGIVHRDLKPENLFIEEVGGEWSVKVIDFGIARVSNSTVQTTTGSVFGTPAYMSPEQAQGEEITLATDLYSLGIIAFECLTGALPFTGTTPLSVLLKHLNEPPPQLPAELDASTEPSVNALIQDLLAKPVEGRPADASELRARVRACLKAIDNASEAPEPPPRRAGWLIAALLSAAALGGGGWWWAQTTPGPAMSARVEASVVDATVRDAASVIGDAAPVIVDAAPIVVDAAPVIVDAMPVFVDAAPKPKLKPKRRRPAPTARPKVPKIEAAKPVALPEYKVSVQPARLAYSVYEDRPQLRLVNKETKAQAEGVRWTLLAGQACARLKGAQILFKTHADGDTCKVKIRGCAGARCAEKTIQAMKL